MTIIDLCEHDPMREIDLLHHIYGASTDLPSRVRLGPGDDMALLDLDDRRLLVAVDQVIEGRHYAPETTPIELVGRKAIMRSVSDVAAMAAVPIAALATAALPPNFGRERSERLFDAMRVAAAEADCPLIGGDIALLDDAGHPLVCTVTVLASPVGRAITRGGAVVGDAVYVTGALGGSVTGVEPAHHLTFQARIAEALDLAARLGDHLHAMIDISDGLGRDAAHIARASDASIEIDVDRIPARAGIPWRRAAGEGEDYELLFTAAGDVPATIGDEVPVTRVGRVIDHPGGDAPRVVMRDGERGEAGDELGWQHES
ncbi:MAG: thiamine-phosphate kinase [Planctomycetes bacterium]|nr:thiamine-phosphate kinase [Planctomycetota bacterium]